MLSCRCIVSTKDRVLFAEKHGIDGIGLRIGIAIRNWQSMTHYKEEIAKAADQLSENLIVVLSLFLCSILRMQKQEKT